MKRASWFAFALLGLLPLGCGGGGGGGGGTGVPVALTASPASFTFPLDNNSPVTIAVTRSGGPFVSLALGVADPTIIGLTPLTLNGNTATLSVNPVARGSTSVTAVDGTGASVSVPIATATCGRPASLVAAQQVLPASGASGVSPAAGTMYFIAYYAAGPQSYGNLHLTVGAHGTQEGGALARATLPAGTATPAPLSLPGSVRDVVSASAPALVTGQSYRTQLYNDTCQPAIIAGSFST